MFSIPVLCFQTKKCYMFKFKKINRRNHEGPTSRAAFFEKEGSWMGFYIHNNTVILKKNTGITLRMKNN